MNIKGYKINFLGDSITEGVGVSDRENCRYDKRLASMCELEAAYNYGIGGTRIAHHSRPSEVPRHDLCFCGRAYNMSRAADMVVVYGGVNDYLHGDAPFGAIGDTTPATYCGGVYFLMKLLREIYSDKPIIFMTPARCYWGKKYDDTKPSIHPFKLDDKKPLYDYVDVIVKTAGQFDIHVLNLYSKLGLDPHDEECYAKYTTDGLHFNDAGHEILANCLKDFIEKL